MQKFTITVNRYQTAEFEVEADTFEEAREKAIDKACDTDWAYIDHWYQTADENGVFND